MRLDHPTAASLPDADRRLPTRRQAALFAIKVSVLRAVRAMRERLGERPRRFPRSNPAPDLRGPVLAEARASLYQDILPAEFALQAGKVQNLRVATAKLHGVIIPAGEVFSFWTHVGRPTRHAGFVPGRELREGCVVPSIGGGLCQLSNALYDAALRAGLEIVERHAHSRRLPGSMSATGRDATVFWNHVDLRFRAPTAGCRIEALLTREELLVRFLGVDPAAAAPESGGRIVVSVDAVAARPLAESCETCDVTACFRHPGRADHTTGGITAWLVDTHWPEFDRYARETRVAGDHLFLPLDGKRWRLHSYGWNTDSFARVRQAPLETLHRSWVSRRLSAQGAARQRSLLAFDAGLAARYARNLPPEATHLVVSQSLLPFLWQAGALGGRSFDVLMTRLPLAALQAALDRAAAAHPDSSTLADFRAEPALLAAESDALAEATRWITPHSTVAKLAGSRVQLVPWQLPTRANLPATPPALANRTVLFPASTLGRKGAFELRQAAREAGLRVRLGGPVLEGSDFWRGVDTERTTAGWEKVTAVVLPAWVEHQPRRLLLAAAAGVPVIASEACGLADVPGVTTVPTGDAVALLAAVCAATPALARAAR